MTITESRHTLVVEAEVSHYVIEPIRFTLGLTRVQMVDDHLSRMRGRRGPDVDALLDARAQFVREETP